MNSGKVLVACAITALLGVAGCHKDNDADDVSTAADTTAPAANASTGLAGNSSTAPAMSTSAPDPGTSTGNGMDSSVGYAQMDQNHDGSLTPDEIPPGDPLKRDFKAADSNGDGKLSEDEVSSYRGTSNASPDNPPMASPGS